MTNFRALCVELTDCLEKSDWPRQYKPVFEQWIYIARKALAEPEPEVPTDEELLELAEDWPCTTSERHDLSSFPEFPLFSVYEDEVVDFARDVLARWGNYPGSPDSINQQS